MAPVSEAPAFLRARLRRGGHRFPRVAIGADANVVASSAAMWRVPVGGCMVVENHLGHRPHPGALGMAHDTFNSTQVALPPSFHARILTRAVGSRHADA